MMIELIQMFLDAYHFHIDPDYSNIPYFDSIITVAVIICLLVGALGLALVTAWGTFKIIVGVFGRD